MPDRKFSRRDIVKYGSAASLAMLGGRLALAAPVPPHPNPAKFQSGDLLWPAMPGAFIPRYAVRGIEPNEEAVNWAEEKRKFIESARASGDPGQQAVADELEHLSYKEFQARYFGAKSAAPGGGNGTNLRGFEPRGLGIPEVGHVAIIEVDASGVSWVIEATPRAKHRYESLYSHFKNGVIRSTYSDWINLHNEYNVWHGRLKDVSKAKRGRIADAAKPFLGKDYWFWSFNLSDDTAFYCSKLVWVSVWKSINLALDGDSSYARSFWVTPKQLINSKYVDLLHNPGTYGGK